MLQTSWNLEAKTKETLVYALTTQTKKSKKCLQPYKL